MKGLTINEQIRLYSYRKGLSLSQLAHAMGTTKQNLSNMMTRDNYNIHQLERIATALGCRLEVEFIPNDET